MKKLPFIFAAMVVICLVFGATGCIEDEFTTSPSDVLSFSTDTVSFDTVITGEGTPTKQFLVYNRSSKVLNISSIRVEGVSQGHFFLNVDGTKGEEFHDIEVRGNDSIYVFVESVIDPTGNNAPVEYRDRIEFVTNGVTQTVALHAWGQDVTRLNAVTVTADTRLNADRPYVITDSLVVAEGATLTLDAGVTLLMHDKATIDVRGTMIAEGTAQKPILIRGDRLDHVVGEIGFDIMSGQWGGLTFHETSTGNDLSHLTMRGSSTGLTVKSLDPSVMSLHMLNCVLHNASTNSLTTVNAWVEGEGCEVSDAAQSIAQFNGGKVRFTNCTFANYYLFKALAEAIVEFADYNGVMVDCVLANCIIYGNGPDVNIGDLTGLPVYLRNCLLKSEGTDDANFINCVWGGDPKFYTVREDYVFDYRLHDESDAIGRGDRALCPESARYDRYGNDRFIHALDLGAYVWIKEGSF